MNMESPSPKSSLNPSIQEESLNDPVQWVITDLFYPESHTIVSRIGPIIFWGIFCLAGLAQFYFNEILSPERTQVILFWLFTCLQLIIFPYLLKFIKHRINDTIEESHKINQITKEKHLKLKQIIFGKGSFVCVILFIMLFGLYDFNGLWITTEEGWLNDLNNNPMQIPVDQVYYYVNPTMALLWLIAWELIWFYTSQFIWYAISFTIYLFIVVYKVPYRLEPKLVIKYNVNRKFQRAILAVLYGFAPLITLRFVLQFVIGDVWLSDTIVSNVLLILFLILCIAPHYMIYDDLQDDMDLEYKKSEKLSLESMEEAVVQAEKGTSIDPSLAMKALLLRENFNEMKQRQQAQKEQRQKLLKAAAGPLLSYLAKLILPLFAL